MGPRLVAFLVVLCLLAGTGRAMAARVNETEGVPIPKSEEEWHCPVEPGGPIVQGNNGKFSHTGTDRFAFDYGVRVGTPLVASRSGIVESSSMLSNIGGPDRAFLADGNQIVIQHSDGTMATYHHLAKNRSLVRVGEFVLQGERIGYSGDTGFSLGPHLHFDGGKLSFSDFKKKDGVPDQGDNHGPPAKPAVPQAAIEAYKAVYRACLYAERVGMPEVGLHVLLGLPAGSRHPEYFYARVLDRKRERYGQEMEKRVNAAKEDKLALAVIKRVAAQTPSLKGLADRISLPEGALGNMEADRLLNACRLEALGDTPQAGGAYAVLASSSSPATRDAAKAGIRRLIANYRSGYEAEMERLVDESSRCLGKHVPVVKKDLEELAAKLTGLVKAWKQHLPEEADKAEDAIKKAESQYTEATKDLQTRR